MMKWKRVMRTELGAGEKGYGWISGSEAKKVLLWLCVLTSIWLAGCGSAGTSTTGIKDTSHGNPNAEHKEHFDHAASCSDYHREWERQRLDADRVGVSERWWLHFNSYSALKWNCPDQYPCQLFDGRKRYSNGYLHSRYGKLIGVRVCHWCSICNCNRNYFCNIYAHC